MIDDETTVTYYAVFDGHGGAECAFYLRDNLHHSIKKCFLDQIDGIKETDNLSEALVNCINRAFEETDESFKKTHPTVAN